MSPMTRRANSIRTSTRRLRKKWKADTGETVTIQTSHGGSGKQARSVIDGLDADVVTLALEADIDAIAKGTGVPGKLEEPARKQQRPLHLDDRLPWCARNKSRASRTGAIEDDIQVITPNPKTSGGALELPRRLGLGACSQQWRRRQGANT